MLGNAEVWQKESEVNTSNDYTLIENGKVKQCGQPSLSPTNINNSRQKRKAAREIKKIKTRRKMNNFLE